MLHPEHIPCPWGHSSQELLLGGQFWSKQPLQRPHPLGHRAGAKGLELAPEEPQAEVSATCPVLLHPPALWMDGRFAATNWSPATVFHPGACSSPSFPVLWTHLSHSLILGQVVWWTWGQRGSGWLRDRLGGCSGAGEEGKGLGFM